LSAASRLLPVAPFYAADADLATLLLSFATADVGKILEGVGRFVGEL
jgi:hypothetical protein